MGNGLNVWMGNGLNVLMGNRLNFRLGNGLNNMCTMENGLNGFSENELNLCH